MRCFINWLADGVFGLIVCIVLESDVLDIPVISD